MYVGGVFREKKFLFLINGFVLDKTLSKSFFKSKKRNPLNQKTKFQSNKLICATYSGSILSLLSIRRHPSPVLQ